MKKFFLIIVSLLCFASCVLAQSITFNKEVYELQYARFIDNRCINEYVRPTQNIKNWTNIITVHYFEKQDVKTYINDFLKIIDACDDIQLIKYFPKNNSFSFIMRKMENKKKGYFEYNVLRVEKAGKNSIVVLQFAHKYKFKDQETFSKAFNRCTKYNMKYTNLLYNTKIPKVVKEDIN